MATRNNAHYEADHNAVRAILQAVGDGDVERVKNYLQSRGAQGLSEPSPQELLNAAMQGSSPAMLNVLFEHGAIIGADMGTVERVEGRAMEFFEVLAAYGWPAGRRGFANSLNHGHEVVKLLLDKGARVDVLCLHNAAELGDFAVMDLLLRHIDPRSKVPNVNDMTKYLTDSDFYWSPEMMSADSSYARIINEAALLQTAAARQHADMVQFLLARGARVDLVPPLVRQYHGQSETALQAAVGAWRNGSSTQPAVVEALLRAGADPLLQNERGLTAVTLNEFNKGGAMQDEIRRLLHSGQRG